MIYLLCDDLIGEERLAALRAGVGSADLQSLNLTILDGQKLSIAELRAAADALPFLGERRLVIVRRFFGAASRGESSAESASPRRGSRGDHDREQDLYRYLPSVPPTTDLVFVEDPDFSADHLLARLVRQLGGEVVLGGAPRWDQIADWITQRVRAKGGRIEAGAVQHLAALSFADLRQLDHALDILVVYAAGRPIGAADVMALVPQTREVKVFDLVDAVGARDRRVALDTYRRLVADDVSPIYILVMLTRQIRLILLAHDALAAREDLAAALKLPPRIAHKVGQQARAFSVERCLAAYERLAEIDHQIKIGEADAELAVELLLVELTER